MRRSSKWLALAMGALVAVVTGSSALARGPAAVVRDAPNDRREIALTIDDGYDTAVCREMVRTLRAMDVPATFFPIGKNVKANPAFWKNVSRDFPIANHTGFHGLLPPLDDARVRKQIRSAEWAVQNATGKPIMKVLRPPGGAWDDRIRRIAGSLGYKALLTWDVSSADTSLHGKPSGMLRAATRGGRGSVLLMHCNRQISADILPKIIRYYQKRGFRFVTVDQVLQRRGIKIAPFKAQADQKSRKNGKKNAGRSAQDAPRAPEPGTDVASVSDASIDVASSAYGWWTPMFDAVELVMTLAQDRP